MELLFKIQEMCFIERNKIDSYFSELKNHYNNKSKKFLSYFSRTWLGIRYPKKFGIIMIKLIMMKI